MLRPYNPTYYLTTHYLTTKDMIDDIEMYITNIDTVYENAIDTVNDMVVGI